MSSDNPETRQKIMKAAWRLLEEKPGTAVRMSDIAKAAGISRQAVYLHFPTRAEMLIETARYLDEVLKVDERLAASRTAATGRARLDSSCEGGRADGAQPLEFHGVSEPCWQLPWLSSSPP